MLAETQLAESQLLPRKPAKKRSPAPSPGPKAIGATRASSETRLSPANLNEHKRRMNASSRSHSDTRLFSRRSSPAPSEVARPRTGPPRLPSESSSRRPSTVGSTVLSEAPSRRASYASPQSSSGRPGTSGILTVSYKPALYNSNSCQPRSSEIDVTSGRTRRVALKSFQGCLGESYGPFSWRKPFSGSRESSTTRASSRASSKASRSTFSVAGLELLQLTSTDQGSPIGSVRSLAESMSSRSKAGVDEAVDALGASSRSSSPRTPPVSPRTLADREAAARLADMTTPLMPGALFASIYLSSPGYETQPRAVVSRPDFEEVNDEDFEGKYALHVAAEKGLVDVCSFLLDCEEYSRANSVDRIGRTALHCAAAGGRAEVCNLLLNHPRFTVGEARNIAGCTALHCAACAGSALVCRALLEHANFMSVSALDCDGETALHWAAWNGSAAACLVLLEHLSVEAVNVLDNRGRTALHLAALHGCATACQELLQHPNFKVAKALTDDGSSAYHLALEGRHREAQKVLFKLAC